MTACDVIYKIGLDFVYPSSRQGSVFFLWVPWNVLTIAHKELGLLYCI